MSVSILDLTQSLRWGFEGGRFDPTGAPLWARFYEIGANRPIFSGRDGVVKYSLQEIEAERRADYQCYVTTPANLLARDYPAWRTRWSTERK